MKRIGIIDLGSNTIRLVIFDVDKSPGKRLRPGQFREILNEKTVAGLSAYVEDGAFTDAGVERAVDVLRDHEKSARNVGCREIRVFATAVLRNCSNSAKVTAEVERQTGMPIDLISGEEEAHLGFVGASIKMKMERGVLIDIGGGSTELTHISDGHDIANMSLAQGSVSSYAGFVSLVLPSHKERQRIRESIDRRIDECGAIAEMHEKRMYGIGGSIRAVAKMLGRMTGSDRATRQISREDIATMRELLEDDPSRFAHLAVKAAPDRLHSMVPGCIIMDAVMDAVGAKGLQVCKYGVREGYLVEHVLA